MLRLPRSSASILWEIQPRLEESRAEGMPVEDNRSALARNSARRRLASARSAVLRDFLICLPPTLTKAKWALFPLR